MDIDIKTDIKQDLYEKLVETIFDPFKFLPLVYPFIEEATMSSV